MALNITKGEWRLYRAGRSVGSASDHTGICEVWERANDEGFDNANLIAEAGTVANECGLTPRQLLEQRNELLEALELADAVLSGANMDISITERKIKSALLKARNASVE